METLIDAKKYLRDNWEKGTDCPCCGQLVKLYSRPMHYTMGAMLIRLYRLSQKDSGYHHVKDIAAGISDTGTNDFSKLKYWGLIEQMPKDPKENKRTSGYWRITQRGVQFVLGQRTEHERVLIFNKKNLGLTGDQIDIKQALGERFNYNELMK